MKNIKISKELLSLVFGCECEFGIIKNNVLHYYYTDEKGLLQPNFENLDTFIMIYFCKTENENLQETRAKLIEEIEKSVAEKVGGEE